VDDNLGGRRRKGAGIGGGPWRPSRWRGQRSGRSGRGIIGAADAASVGAWRKPQAHHGPGTADHPTRLLRQVRSNADRLLMALRLAALVLVRADRAAIAESCDAPTRSAGSPGTPFP